MARIAVRRLGRGRVLNAAICAALMLGLVAVVASTEPADPSPQVQLSSGSAWLVSPSVAAVTLVDGPSEQVVASRRLDANPNDELTVTQAGTDAYAVDHTQGTVARIDGAMFELGPARKFADTAGALRLVGGTAALYALDANRGLASRADPVTLQPQSEISLAARPRPDQIVVDDNGRLWLVDADRGGLIWVDGATKHESDQTPGPNAQLVLVRGRPVLADLAAGELHTLDDDGGLTSTTCLDVRNGAATQLLGSATQETVYGAVSDTGTLLVAGTTTDDCQSALAVSQPHDVLGAPVASDRFVFIPNFTKGTTVIVDTESRQVLSPELNLVDGGHRLELIAKDGLVFYNDLDGDKAGVLTYDGASWRIGKSLSKYDPNTGKPADLDVPALPLTGPGAPANNAEAATPLSDGSGDQPPASDAPQQTDQPREPESPSQTASPPPVNSPSQLNNPSRPNSPSQSNNPARPNNPVQTSNPLQPTNPGQPSGGVVAATFRLQLNVNGDGRVTGPGGIDCPGSCATTVTDQSTVTLVAQPTQSGATVQWTGACAGQPSACSFTAAADAAISVTFTAPQADPVLSVTVDGPGSVEVVTATSTTTCSTTCAPSGPTGTPVTVTATPIELFSGWTGPCRDQTSTCTFTINAAAAVTATFATNTQIGPIAPDDSTPGIGQRVTFSATESGNGDRGSWSWSYSGPSSGGAASIVPPGSDFTATFDADGDHVVSLVVTHAVGPPTTIELSISVSDQCTFSGFGLTRLDFRDRPPFGVETAQLSMTGCFSQAVATPSVSVDSWISQGFNTVNWSDDNSGTATGTYDFTTSGSPPRDGLNPGAITFTLPNGQASAFDVLENLPPRALDSFACVVEGANARFVVQVYDADVDLAEATLHIAGISPDPAMTPFDHFGSPGEKYFQGLVDTTTLPSPRPGSWTATVTDDFGASVTLANTFGSC